MNDMEEQEYKYKPSLCFRCEHRALHLEHAAMGNHYQPRCECGDIKCSKYSCYMFKPVGPVILGKDNKNDPRSVVGPSMLSARSHIISLAEGKLIVKGTEEQYVKYWLPSKPKCVKQEVKK